jgi:hypothetical protein
MGRSYNADARRRAVNLTLDEDLARKRQERADQVKMLESTVAMWNQFADEKRPFADDHSTL